MRLIDADKATKILHTILDPLANKKLIWLAWDVILEDCETIDAEPIRHGKWIWEEQVYKCSVCSHKAYGNILECMDGTYKYCPNCGARMEETDEAD